MDIFIFFHLQYIIRFHKVTSFSLLFKFILSARLSNSVLGSDILLSSEFMNTEPIFSNTFIEFYILLIENFLLNILTIK